MSFRYIPVAFAAAVILSAQTEKCQVRGQVLDTSGASIGRSLISVFAKESLSLVSSENANEDGTFCIEDLSPGTYTLKSWSRGFRAKRVHDVTVRNGETSDVGTLTLDLASCDSGQFSCCLQVRTLDTPPPPPDPIVAIHLNLPRSCGVVAASGVVVCPNAAGLAKDASVAFLEDHGALFLRPANGALLDPDCKDAYDNRSVRIEGLGTGDDLCVKTRNGYTSHVSFEGDNVQANTMKLNLWMVTRK